MFKSVMQLYFFILSLLAVAYALPLAIRDVFVPPVTSPTTGTVWTIGSQQNVTWDTSNAPAQITNPTGEVFLAKGGIIDLKHPLATNFSLLDGFVPVTVPENVVPGTDYTVVLFGDSGNDSPQFTIAAAMLSGSADLDLSL